MAKRKTTQELMAERNPLTRTPVTPVDIYSQPLEPTKEPAKQEPIATTAEKKAPQARSPETPLQKRTSDRVRPYSTYLFQSQVKGIKLRAIEREADDKDIVQEAIGEYFKNHPLHPLQ